MTVKLTCSGCKAVLQLRDELAGKKVRCPRCAATVVVPAAEAVAEVVPEEVEPADDAITDAPVPRRAKAQQVPVKKASRKRRDEEAEDEQEYKPCPQCGAGGATRVIWTPWGSFYGPALFTHVRCPECGYGYNGNSGRSNLIPAIIFVAIPTLLILAIIGFVVYMIMDRYKEEPPKKGRMALAAVVWNDMPCQPALDGIGSKDRPAAIDGQADTGHEIVVEEEQHGLDDVLRPAFAFNQRGVDGLPAFPFRQVRR
jgi:ribosomal protein S27AE